MALDWTASYTVKNRTKFVNQRNNAVVEFGTGQIIVQVEGQRGNTVSIRGKYPNDDFFATTEVSNLTPTSQKKEELRKRLQKAKEGLDALKKSSTR